MHTHPGTACPTRGRQHRAAGESQRSRARGALCCTPGRPRLALAPLRNPLWARRLSQATGEDGCWECSTWDPSLLLLHPLQALPLLPTCSGLPSTTRGRAKQCPRAGLRVFTFCTNWSSKRPSGLEDTAWKLQGADIPGVTSTNISMRKGIAGAVAALFWVVFGAAAPAEASTGCQGRSGSSDDICRLTG